MLGLLDYFLLPNWFIFEYARSTNMFRSLPLYVLFSKIMRGGLLADVLLNVIINISYFISFQTMCWSAKILL